MTAPVTAESLARALGLSRATVSIVLRGDAERRKISPATTRRVLDAAREYNYVPNQAARMLRRQRTDLVGVVLPDFRLDWAEGVMDGMLDVFGRSTVTPFVAIHRFNPDLFRKEILSALQRRDDAIICYPIPGMNDLYAQVRAMGIPLIFIGDRPAGYADAHWVVWDAGAAATAAVRHLVDEGCRRIGFLGMDFPMHQSRARVKAYKAVLAAAGRPVNEQWICAPAASKPTLQIIDEGLAHIFGGTGPKPDGLFVLNDGLALPALDRLSRLGVRVPEDVKLVGMGDVPLAGQHGVGLTTAREPLPEMGRAAAEQALACIAEPSGPLARRVIVCNDLRIRRTTVGQRWRQDEPGAFNYGDVTSK